MEWFCHKAFEMQFKERFDEIQFQTGDKFVEHFFVNDHCFIVCHGKDSEDMKNLFLKILMLLLNLGLMHIFRQIRL